MKAAAEPTPARSPRSREIEARSVAASPCANSAASSPAWLEGIVNVVTRVRFPLDPHPGA